MVDSLYHSTSSQTWKSSVPGPRLGPAWPKLLELPLARVPLARLNCSTANVQVYLLAAYLVVYTYIQVRSVAWVRCVCQQPLSLPPSPSP